MISAKIRDEDKEFLKNHDIGITELIQTAISHRKNEIEGFSTTITEEREKRIFFQNKFNLALKFMDERGIIDEWIKKHGN